MKEDYKGQITTQIRDAVNQHIGRLKEEKPELLLTKQWRIHWPKGFSEGHNTVSVITSCKDGQYLVAHVQFILPPSMELDLEAVQLELKDEPFMEEKSVSPMSSPDDPLDLLNDLVTGINGFLESLGGGISRPAGNPIFEEKRLFGSSVGKPLTVHSFLEPGTTQDSGSIEEIRRRMERSPYLPEWYSTIHSQKVADDLLLKLAEGYLHYNRQRGRTVSLEEFFRHYSDYLLREDRLHTYCPYKGKPVSLDSDNWCTENYCSKKPYHAECPQVALRFGAQPEDH